MVPTPRVDQSVPWILQFSGDRHHINCGRFWPTDGNLPAGFWWSFLVCPLHLTNGYVLSDGFGGLHALLAGFPSSSGSIAVFAGNVYNATESISWSAEEGLYVGEWGWVEIGWDANDNLFRTWVNGIPCTSQAFSGPRRSPAWVGSGGSLLYLGGSDHSNYIGRLGAVVGYDRAKYVWGNYSRPGKVAHEYLFPPPLQFYVAPETWHDADFQMVTTNYGGPGGLLIPDNAPLGCVDANGSTVKRRHPGILTRQGDYLATHPRPAWVPDPTFPYQSLTAAPTPPSGYYAAATSPSAGATRKDSFARNSRHLFWGSRNLGALEYTTGSAEEWQEGPIDPSIDISQSPGNQLRFFGLFHNQAVYLSDDKPAVTWVTVPSANSPVRCRRTWGNNTGIGMTLVWRLQDRSNFWFARVTGSAGSPGGRVIRIGKVVAGAMTPPDGEGSTHQVNGHNSGWAWLKVVPTETTFQVYCDDNLVDTLTNQTTFQSATKAGLANLIYAGEEIDALWRVREFEALPTA